MTQMTNIRTIRSRQISSGATGNIRTFPSRTNTYKNTQIQNILKIDHDVDPAVTCSRTGELRTTLRHICGLSVNPCIVGVTSTSRNDEERRYSTEITYTSS